MFLDWSKAFDKILDEKLIEVLEKKGVDPHLIELCENGSGVFVEAALLTAKQFREVPEFAEHLDAQKGGKLPKNITMHKFSDLKVRTGWGIPLNP